MLLSGTKWLSRDPSHSDLQDLFSLHKICQCISHYSHPHPPILKGKIKNTVLYSSPFCKSWCTIKNLLFRIFLISIWWIHFTNIFCCNYNSAFGSDGKRMVGIVLDFVSANCWYVSLFPICNMLIIHRFTNCSMFNICPFQIQILIYLPKGILPLPYIILKVINPKSILPSTFYYILQLQA